MSRAPHDFFSSRLITRLLPLQPTADLLSQQERGFLIGGSAVKPSSHSRLIEFHTFSRRCVSCALPSCSQRSALIPAPPWATPTVNPAPGQRLPLCLGNAGPFLAFLPGSASGVLVNSSLNTEWCHKAAADVIERQQLWPFMCFISPLALSLLPSPWLQLAKNLPPRTIGYPWTLAFGTSKHGMSIKTLYRAMQGQDTPVLMVIKDSDGQVRKRISTLQSGRERCIITGR